MTETAHDVLAEVLHTYAAPSAASTTEREAYFKRLEAALENERRAVAQRCFVNFMHTAKQIADEAAEWPAYGGSDAGEPDCPRERGSQYRRPEGLSAGARARFWH